MFLNKAISLDRYISVKALNEQLLIKHNYVRNFLKELSYKTRHKALEDLKELKEIAHKNTLHKNAIRQIEQLVKKETYLDSLKALENIGYELEN
jgi:Zn-dependent oligopeptidase